MFLHLEIGSSKPIEVKTGTRGIREEEAKERGRLLASESTDKAGKSIKEQRTNLDRNFAARATDEK